MKILRLNRYHKSSSERIFDLAEKSELLPFDPVFDDGWNDEEYFNEISAQQNYRDLSVGSVKLYRLSE